MSHAPSPVAVAVYLASLAALLLFTVLLAALTRPGPEAHAEAAQMTRAEIRACPKLALTFAWGDRHALERIRQALR